MLSTRARPRSQDCRESGQIRPADPFDRGGVKTRACKEPALKRPWPPSLAAKYPYAAVRSAHIIPASPEYKSSQLAHLPSYFSGPSGVLPRLMRIMPSCTRQVLGTPPAHVSARSSLVHCSCLPTTHCRVLGEPPPGVAGVTRAPRDIVVGAVGNSPSSVLG